MSRGSRSLADLEYAEIGDRLREARRGRGLSLRALADQLGVSPSLISQVETGRARPSVSTLYAIVTRLDISLDDLLFLDGRATSPSPPERPGGSNAAGEAQPSGPVQRASGRKAIRLASGVVWERLTTTSDPDLEFLYVTYEVGGASSPEDGFQRHGGREWGFVLSGTLGVTIGFDDYQLGAGDAVSLDSTMPHRLYNRGTEPVHAVWFVMGRHSLDVDPRSPKTSGSDRQPPDASTRSGR